MEMEILEVELLKEEILKVEPLMVVQLLRVVKHLILLQNQKEILNKFRGHKESKTSK